MKCDDRCYKPKPHLGVTIGAAVAGTFFALVGAGLIGREYTLVISLTKLVSY